MHKAPNNVEKYLYVDQNKWGLLLVGLFSTTILFVGNAFFIQAFPGFWPYIVFVFVTFFYLSISYFVGILGKKFDLKEHKRLVDKHFNRTEAEEIDIFLPVCGEDLKVITNTWDHVQALRVMHTNVKVWVLDDSNSSGIRHLANGYGFNYINRGSNELKKAGNLRHAFALTDSRFIVIFDADFCPRTDFLVETLPYMYEDESVAIVQTPQYFSVYQNQNWIRKGAALVQELFYRLIQVNRNTFNGAICVGTCALYRRSHLEPFGGTAPIEYSEDVHTGFQVITNGKKIKYLPVNLSGGECPDSLRQFFTQQYRWSLGSISLFFSRKFWHGPLTIMQRVCYLSGMFFYITTGLGVFFVYVPSMVLLLVWPQHILWFNLVFSLPSLLFSTAYMKTWQKLPFSFDAIRIRHVSYFAHLFALKDFLFKSLEEWKPTGAKTSSKRFDAFKEVYRFHTTFTTVFVFVLIAIRVGEGYQLSNFSLLIFFTLYNAFISWPILKELHEN